MNTTPLSAEGQALKAAFIADRGFWVEEYEGLAALCPAFLEAHLASQRIATAHPAVSPLLNELIAIAIDVSTTHLFASGLRLHIRAALKLGARPEQVAAVILLVSGIGQQSQLVGLPLLDSLLAERGVETPDPAPDAATEARHRACHGQWSAAHDRVRAASPAHFEAQLRLSESVTATGLLSARERALLLVATNGAVTHLHPALLEASIGAALDAGATPDEIEHVLRRISSLGMHSVMTGFPILMSELARIAPAPSPENAR